MRRRPLPVLVLGWLFIVVGSVGLVYHLSELKARQSVDLELVLVCMVRLLAIVGGVFVLRGHAWARWLLAAWMAFHIVLSIFHSPAELAMHVLLFGVIGYFLFRPASSAYFARTVTIADVERKQERQ